MNNSSSTFADSGGNLGAGAPLSADQRRGRGRAGARQGCSVQHGGQPGPCGAFGARCPWSRGVRGGGRVGELSAPLSHSACVEIGVSRMSSSRKCVAGIVFACCYHCGFALGSAESRSRLAAVPAGCPQGARCPSACTRNFTPALGSFPEPAFPGGAAPGRDGQSSPCQLCWTGCLCPPNAYVGAQSPP